MDVPDPSTLPQGWAAIGAALLLVCTALWAALSRKWKRKDEDARKAAENHERYIAALHDWQDAIEGGDASAAAAIAEELDTMRKAGWHIAPLVALVFVAVAGCRTTEAPPPAPPLLLTEHVRIVAPGETVPPLPEGERIWWLATPTGMRRLLPADSQINRETKGETK